MKTHNGYVHPSSIKNGLSHILMYLYTDKELDTFPQVKWTLDVDWDPAIVDQPIIKTRPWFDTVSDLEHLVIHNLFDKLGTFTSREAELYFFDVGELPASDDYGNDYGELPNGEPPDEEPPDIDDDIDRVSGVIFAYELQRKSTSTSDNISTPAKTTSTPSTRPTPTKPKPRDYESLRPFFFHQFPDTIKRTFQATTQYACINIGGL